MDDQALNHRPVPEAALRDKGAIELARVWVAERGLHCSLRIGLYADNNIAEEKAWGTILADIARHVTNGLESKYGIKPEVALKSILGCFSEELASPTSEVKGNFVKKH